MTTPRLLRRLRRRRSAHRRAQACEIRQSEMQELGLLARRDRRGFSRSEIKRGERAQRLTADAARAARDHVDPFAARDIARAGVELEQACFAAPLVEDAYHLLRDARRAFDRHPVIVHRVHEDRLRITRLGIDHGPPVHVFPDRLVAVEIALALDVGASAEHAVLELALGSELAHSGLHLGLREVAAAARAAELQHDGLAGDVGVLALRAVIDRLREIADHAGNELAVATVVERAFELVADLLEIVPVTGRVESPPIWPNESWKLSSAPGSPSTMMRPWNVPPRCSRPRFSGISSVCTIFIVSSFAHGRSPAGARQFIPWSIA